MHSNKFEYPFAYAKAMPFGTGGNLDLSVNEFPKVDISYYIKKMNEIDAYGIDKLINNSVVWNSKKQKVNKGTYYVFKHNNNLYNILVSDEIIRIDERIPVGEETENRVLTFNDSKYQYFRCINDKNGSSYACRYYEPNDIPMLELTRDEFLTDFYSIMQNISSFTEIENIIDLNALNKVVTKSINEDILSK